MSKRTLIKILTIICITITTITFAFTFLFSVLFSHFTNSKIPDAASIGIIGGADGPTSILVSGISFLPLSRAFFSLLSILGIVYLYITRKKNTIH